MAGRARNARGEGARLREEIVDAAIALLDDGGSPGILTLRGIARRAGISAPPIYAHFDDLPSLVDAVRSRSFEDLSAVVAAAIESAAIESAADDGSAAALVAAGHAYVRFGQEHPARYRLMFSSEGYAANAIDTFALVESLIAQSVDAGIGHSENPRLDTWMVWAALHGVATLEKPARAGYRRLGPLDRPAMLATMIRRLARLDEQS